MRTSKVMGQACFVNDTATLPLYQSAALMLGQTLPAKGG